MKRNYVKPAIQKIDFCYRDQVVASSGSQTTCHIIWQNENADQKCPFTGPFLDQLPY